MVESYGADALRLYLLFKAPFNADIEWENKGVEDLSKFLSRIFRMVEAILPVYAENWRDLIGFEELSQTAKEVRRATHQTIRNASTDIERFSFNTYVSWLMKFVNTLSKPVSSGAANEDRSLSLALSEAIEALILLIAPGAPHSADELWSSLGKVGFTYHAEWPKFDEELAKEDVLTIAIQVAGKLRDTVEVPAGASDKELEDAALASTKIQAHLEGKTVRKVIVIPGKLVNIVAN